MAYIKAKDEAEERITPAELKILAKKCGVTRSHAYEKCGIHFCSAKSACGKPCKKLPFEPTPQIVPVGSKTQPQFYKVENTLPEPLLKTSPPASILH